MADLVLSPVSVAVYGKLNVAAVTALATGGISDDPAQGTSFPFIWYEVSEREMRGLGTSGFPEVVLTVHVFSRYQGMREAQNVMQQVIAALKDQSLTIAGYAHAGQVFYDDTLMFSPEMLNGVKVHELVSRFRIYAEESA